MMMSQAKPRPYSFYSLQGEVISDHFVFRPDRSSTSGKAAREPPSALSSFSEPPKLSTEAIRNMLDEIKAELSGQRALNLLAEVERKFAEQSTEVNELRRYKEKWRNLKRDARKNASTIQQSSILNPNGLSTSISSSASSTIGEKKI
jgi:hypothetical protein